MSRYLRLCIAVLATGMLSVRGADTVEELLAKGSVFDKRYEPERALMFYEEANRIDPANATVLARIARQYRYEAIDALSVTEKVRFGREAVRYSEKAVAADADNAEAQLSLAISLGKLLPLVGKREQVAMTPRIKTSVDRAIALDPANDLAWHILGRWHRVLAEVGGVKRTLAGAFFGQLPKGTFEEAAAALERAKSLNPNRLMHYIELGRVYADMGRTEEARKLIEKGLSMPNVEKDDFETKARGREALAALH